MSILAGIGYSLWNPDRLSLEAFASLPATFASEVLTSEVISAQATYGSLGACQGGGLTVNDLPQEWGAGGRVIRLKLEDASEGTFYVHAGLLDQPGQKPGELGRASLLPPHVLYVDRPGQGAELDGLTLGLSAFGVGAPSVPAHETLAAVMTRTLAAYPTAEFGINADLIVVLGHPDAAQFATLDLGNPLIAELAFDFEQLGRIIPPYVTDAIFDPGDGWEKTVLDRGGEVPDLVIRRTGQARADPTTLKVTAALPGVYFANLPGTPSTETPLVYEYGTYKLTRNTWFLTVTEDTPQARFSDFSVQLSVDIQNVEARTVGGQESVQSGNRITFQLVDEADFAVISSAVLVPQLGQVGVYGAGFIIPATYKGGSLRAEVLIEQNMLNTEKGHRLTLAIKNAVIEGIRETPNLAELILPEGWYMPYSVGPIFRFKLPGWHVPPFKVTGLPGGVEQMAAGATVTWNKNECSTEITTVAWPYPGQRRGG